MTLRTLIRHAVQPLPFRVQLFLKRANAVLWNDDWAAPIKHLRLQESDALEVIAREHRQLEGRKRLLIFSLQQAPPWLDVEYGLATALQLRGHSVRGVLCDGIMPLCEMNLGGIERPPCAVCAGWLERYEEAFGFQFSRLSDFLSEQDRDLAERVLSETPDRDLSALVVDNVEVGRLARRELQRYRRGFVFEPENDPAYRKWIASALLLVRLANQLLDRERPDIVIAGSGRTLPSACLRKVAGSKGIHVVTWDTEQSHPDGLVFSHNDAAVELPLDQEWSAASSQRLTGAEREQLTGFLDRWARSETTPYPYNPAPLEDSTLVRTALKLRPEEPLIVAFPNSAWDVAVIDRDVGFGSMFEWLFALVDYAARNPDIHLVVRAHPGETNVPRDIQSRTPVANEIRSRYVPLPNNVRLVEGNTPISSYTLADMATVAMVYSSRIGLEMAVRGKRPWLAGAVTYRGKGFTRDLVSKEEMLGLLDRRCFDDGLASAEIELAERFAYLWFFRYVTRLPLLRSGCTFALKTFQDLAPGSDVVLDRLCEGLVAGTPFIDLHEAPFHTTAKGCILPT